MTDETIGVPDGAPRRARRGGETSRRTRDRSDRTRRATTPPPRSAADHPALPQEDTEDALPVLRSPAGELAPVIDRIQPMLAWCERAASAPEEPVAVDAERASSYRYSAKAYLLQLRTESAGTALVDPTAFALPNTLRETLADREWVLHAATQDLPSLAELELQPHRLFDTELAARLLGMPRVGLGAVVEDTLGLRLAKEHSAADWSTRPLPEPWLVYAALDVEMLVRIRDLLAERLAAAGKSEWAEQEFAHLLAHPLPATREEPWRRLHGIGGLRQVRQLAAARALWTRRDEIASREDLAPHRVLKDRDLVAAAKVAGQGRTAFAAALPAPVRGKDAWWQAARSGWELAEPHLPTRPEQESPPPHKVWSKKYPEVWERLVPVRDAVAARAEELAVPTENLLQPALLRRWVWEHESADDPSEVAAELSQLGARPWQAELVAPVIARAMNPSPSG